MNKHRVFVYGTLRRGGLRAMPTLFPDASFLGTGTVKGTLHDLGPYPGLLLNESQSLVVGEVYQVDDQMLERLDEIEDESNYFRKEVEVTIEGGNLVCWVYVYDPSFHHDRKLIPSGDWIEYAKSKTDWPDEI